MTALLPDAPFVRADLAELGMSQRALRAALAERSVRHVFRGVYVATSVPDSVELRARAAARVMTADQVLVDRSAALLHGVDTLQYEETDLLPPLETARVGSPLRATRHPEARGRRRTLGPGDVTMVEGIRVTTPARTALDLGCNLRRREAFAALVALIRCHDLRVEDLVRELPRFRGRRGVCQLRELLALVDIRLESAREAWTWLALADARIAMPEPQVWVGPIDGPSYRLDFAWRRQRVALEYDGEEAHLLTEEQIRDDADRRAWLREAGWTVIVIRLGDFGSRRLEEWIGEVRKALRPTYSNLRW